jgi:hypothetical protein
MVAGDIYRITAIMKSFYKNTPLSFLFNILFLGQCLISRAQFTTGNVVVLQVGDGVNSLVNTGNPIILREFNSNGVQTFSVNVPSTGNTALVNSGAAGSEGILSNSADKRYLVFGAYNQALPNTTGLAGSASSVIARAIGIVDIAGNYSLAASSNSMLTGNNIRSATSDGLGNYWAGGAVDGTDYLGTASTPTNIQNIKTNTRATAIFNGQLYLSTQSTSGTQTMCGVYAIGSGISSAGGQSITNIINTGNGSQPVQFYFQPGVSPTVCYVADSRSTAGGGVQKWIYTSSTWSLAYTIPTSTSNPGANGVVVDFSGGNPLVYATSIESTNNRLESILDNGASASATTIATASNNAIFRGLAFSPCSTPTINSVASSGTICSGQVLTLSVSASGGSLTTFNWYGAGAFSSSTAAVASVTGATSGVYTVQATNTCGSSFSSITVTVNSGPQLTVTASSPSVCLGQALSLTATGATSYTWSGNLSNGAFFTPTASTIYTVNAVSLGCNSTQTVAITVNTISLSIIPLTICNGQAGTLTASGAASYTWNGTVNSATYVISPTVSTSYSLSGTSLQGCVGSTTTQVVVTNSPVASVNSATVCSGASATLIASGINTYSWSNGAQTPSIVVSPTANASYTITGTLSGCPGTASNVVSVQVNPPPTITVAGNTSLCKGFSANLTAAGASTYTWSINVQTATVVLSPTNTTVYSVSGTSSLGCTAATQLTLTVLPLPTVSIATSTPICAGRSATIQAGGASTYTWSNSLQGYAITVTPTITTIYTVTGTSVNGCQSGASTTLTVIAAPNLTVTSGNATICVGEEASISVMGAASYTWSGGSTQSQIYVSPTVNTTYTVSGTNSLGCVSTSQYALTVSACVGFSENINQNVVALFPNPANEKIIIKIKGSNTARIIIATISGQIVFTGNVKNDCSISTSDFEPGIYHVQILSEDDIVAKKLIISR